MASRVSVVIPTHNRAHLLARSIRSVLRQTVADLEVLVVDDASTDDTKAVVSSISDDRVKYVGLTKNGGAPKARNVGIEIATSEIIAFQDSDDEWLPEKLERQLLRWDELGSETGAIYCGLVQYFDQSCRYIPSPNGLPLEGDILPALLRDSIISTQTLVARRSILQDIGGFDEKLPRLQDWDVALRLAAVTQFGFVSDPLVIAYDTPGNLSSNKLNNALARMRILDKLAPLFSTSPVDFSRHLYIAGQIFRKSGCYQSARNALRQSIVISPTNLKAILAMALSYRGIGDG